MATKIAHLNIRPVWVYFKKCKSYQIDIHHWPTPERQIFIWMLVVLSRIRCCLRDRLVYPGQRKLHILAIAIRGFYKYFILVDQLAVVSILNILNLK